VHYSSSVFQCQPGFLPKLGRDIGVFEVAKTFAGFGVGRKEVPQTGITRLLLGFFQQFPIEPPVAIGPRPRGSPAKNSSVIRQSTFSRMCFDHGGHSGLASSDISRLCHVRQ